MHINSNGAGDYPVLVHAVALLDDLVDRPGVAPIGSAELDESTAGVVVTRVLDQDVVQRAVCVHGCRPAQGVPTEHSMNRNLDF